MQELEGLATSGDYREQTEHSGQKAGFVKNTRINSNVIPVYTFLFERFDTSSTNALHNSWFNSSNRAVPSVLPCGAGAAGAGPGPYRRSVSIATQFCPRRKLFCKHEEEQLLKSRLKRR